MPEKYQPSPEEIQKAEESMSEIQKRMSQFREANVKHRQIWEKEYQQYPLEKRLEVVKENTDYVMQMLKGLIEEVNYDSFSELRTSPELKQRIIDKIQTLVDEYEKVASEFSHKADILEGIMPQGVYWEQFKNGEDIKI